MKFGSTPLQYAEGALLAHTVAAEGRTWRKGHVLTREDIAAMRACGLTQVIAAVMEEGDLDENEAAARIAAQLAGEGVVARDAMTGRVNLYAGEAGLFTVDRAVIDEINAIDPAITIATLPEFSAVEEGRMLATVKIIPFAVSAALVERATAVVKGRRALALHPFMPRDVGLVQTVLPSVKESVLDKTAQRTAERLSRSHSRITVERRVAHEAQEVAGALGALAPQNGLVVVFGASAVADDEDVIPAAIRLAGGRVERVGMPVDPGNLLVIGTVGDTTVIGAPGCARSPRPNGFDWVLDRVLAGVPVDGGAIAGMGVGGLLMEIDSRPQPREPRERRAPVVHAVLLAAGRGQRMGGPNKLLARFGGLPLVRRVAAMLAASKVRSTVAVVGHQADRVASALDGAGVRIVENPDYVSGLASSLRAGVAALPSEAMGALVALGDMPGVCSSDVDRMIDAFMRTGGGTIVRATHAGKRGNPVILPRRLFAEVAKLEGDTGARHIVEMSELAVIDIEIGEAASIDVDTPEAMALAGGVLAD